MNLCFIGRETDPRVLETAPGSETMPEVEAIGPEEGSSNTREEGIAPSGAAQEQVIMDSSRLNVPALIATSDKNQIHQPLICEVADDTLPALEMTPTTGEQLQVSPGDLNEEPKCSPPIETFEEVAIDILVHFEDIPDYLEPCRTQYPFVVHNAGQYYCIDNWSQVEKAKAEGKTSVLCHVSHIPGCSREDLAFAKSAGRVLPGVGRATCGEIVRNVRLLAAMLLSSGKDLFVFSHGGPRRGTGYPPNREEDLMEVLAERLGKNRDTISKYLNYGRHVAPRAIELLIEGNAPRKFFEASQKRKRKLINRLLSTQTSDEEIAESVSEAMLGWFNHFSPETGIIENTDVETAPADPEQTQEVADTEHQPEEQAPPPQKTFKHHTPEKEAQAEPDTLESLKLGVKTLAEGLLTSIGAENLTPQVLAAFTRATAAELVKISYRAEKLEETARG
ncbi:MAG: hypothetical protein ABSC55_21980 [Syntrophorhabdales bacterium]